ncbi:MAG: hypothetical protein BAJALOKI1v1_1360003 [Promethearchaeota archaeon]|nr:MAG: hypothetical protein BAJALOKI1v1_1360003 [Candidatus Lokiarchaeota archaeon]
MTEKISKKVEDLYKNAVIKMQQCEWDEGREIAWKLISQHPSFLGGWKLLFIYQIRTSTMKDKRITDNLKTDDIPYKLIETSATEEKIRQFKTYFLKHIKQEYED